MTTTSKEIVHLLADILAGHGVRDAICSPGSRNIPLLMGLDASRQIDCRMVTDERSAAFVALGVIQMTRRPVAVVCTSGTALLNYAPAVAEAYYRGLPLIVVSADRPEEWIDQDDSQTIRQPGALDNIVKKCYDIADTDTDRKDGIWYADRIFNDAILTATADFPGPVHINIRINPPLQSQTDAALQQPRIISRITPATVIDRNIIRMLARKALTKRVLLVAGFMQPDDAVNRGVAKLRRLPNVAVMAETISNLHLPAEDYAVDSMLCRTKPEYPEIVISIGGAIVSRMLKEYLRAIPKEQKPAHWSVGRRHTTVDCFQALDTVIDCDPALFLNNLAGEIAHQRRTSSPEIMAEAAASDLYARSVNDIRRECIAATDREAADGGWTECLAIKMLLDAIPAADDLCISNGTAIRYAQILSRKIPHTEFCNRGVSGIDGCTSTAVGMALARPGHTWLLTGDMSLSYDLGGLSAAQNLDTPIRIAVISNQGGGIFRFIKASRDLEIRERMLCVDPDRDLKALASAFGFEYLEASDCRSMKEAIARMKGMNGRALLNITVDGAKSADQLRSMLEKNR